MPVGGHAPPQREAERTPVPPARAAPDPPRELPSTNTVVFPPFRDPQARPNPKRASAGPGGDAANGPRAVPLGDRPQLPPMPPADAAAVAARVAAPSPAPADVIVPVAPAAPEGLPPAEAPDPAAAPKVADPLDTQEDVLLVLEMRTPLGVEERKIVAETIIGRADPLRAMIPDLAFPHDTLISRRHLRIAPRHDYYVAADLNSRNGTRLNGVRLRPNVEMPLRPGDTIEIGESTFLRVLRAPNPKPPGA